MRLTTICNHILRAICGCAQPKEAKNKLILGGIFHEKDIL